MLLCAVSVEARSGGGLLVGHGGCEEGEGAGRGGAGEQR